MFVYQVGAFKNVAPLCVASWPCCVPAGLLTRAVLCSLLLSPPVCVGVRGLPCTNCLMLFFAPWRASVGYPRISPECGNTCLICNFFHLRVAQHITKVHASAAVSCGTGEALPPLFSAAASLGSCVIRSSPVEALLTCAWLYALLHACVGLQFPLAQALLPLL